MRRLEDPPSEPGELLPHRGPALLVERILDVPEGSVLARGRVPRTSFYAAADGHCPAIVALEVAAQSLALAATDAPTTETEGGASSAGPPAAGYLVSIRGASLHRDRLVAGEEIVVETRQVGAVGPLLMHRVAVRDAGGLIAEATLSVYRSG